jgi:hypothetical protein
MATTTVEEREAAKKKNPISSIAEMLASAGDISSLFNGTESTTKTSGGTVTQGLDISQQGVDKMIQDILASTQGLAAVSQGQRGAGIYNSSTNQQLTNDLLDRTTASVARDTAKSVQTTSGGQTTVQQAPKLDLATTLLTTGAGVIGKKILDSGTIDNVLGGIGDIFSGGSSAPASSLVSGVQGLIGSGSGLSFIDSAASGASGISDVIGGISGDAFGGLDFLGGADSFAGGLPIAGIGLDLLSGNPEDALGTAAGYLIGNALLPGIGGPLGSLVSDIIPVGDIFSGIGDLASSLFGGLFGGGSVVCTELLTQGIMSPELYRSDIAYAHAHMETRTLDGYRFWGIPLVRLMRTSSLATKITAWFAINRAHYIASLNPLTAHLADSRRAVVGKRINAVGVPICNFISLFITPKDWSVLYTAK